jgi:hypothetical protein
MIMIVCTVEKDGWLLEATTDDEIDKLKTFRSFLESKSIIVEPRFHGKGILVDKIRTI